MTWGGQREARDLHVDRLMNTNPTNQVSELVPLASSRVVVSGNFPLGLQGRRHSEQDQQYGEQTHGNLDFNQGEMCNLTPSGP